MRTLSPICWNRPLALLTGAAFISTVLSGCVAVPRDGDDGQSTFAPLAPNYPAAAPVQQAAYPAYAQGYAFSAPYGASDQAIADLKQRLDRAEQALLRLDRRMQLVERNELGRMSEGPAQGSLSAQVAPLTQPAMAQSYSAMPAVAAALVPQSEDGMAQSLAANVQGALYQQGIQPVSNPRDTVIRGSLQAAPHTLGSGLPSLADPRNNSQPMPSSAGQLAVWTIRYEPEKIWPDRDQLPDSRQVVETLRNSRTVTVVARGPNPKSQTFQDRVRALSRYLAKVAALDTVPISAMTTQNGDANTIEILATP